MGYSNPFLPCKLALDNRNCIFSHTKLFGKEFNQMGIGLAVYRWGADTNFQTVATQTGELVLAGFWLQMAVQQ